MRQQYRSTFWLSQILIAVFLAGGSLGAELRWKGVTNLAVRADGVTQKEALVFRNDRTWMAMIRLSDQDRSLVIETNGERVGTIEAGSVHFGVAGDVLISADQPEIIWVGTWGQRGTALVFEALGRSWELAPAVDIVGEVSVSKLLAFSPFYPLRLDAYQPHSEALDLLRRYPRKARLTMFFGTWCSLCAEVLPKWMKMVFLAENANLELRLIGLNESLSQPQALVNQYKPKTVPTLVLEIEGRETGRIEGLPQISAEADLVGLLVQGLGRQ